MLNQIKIVLLLLSFSLGIAHAESYESLNADMQRLKADVLRINQELNQLEQNLLRPATTSYTVFLSLSPQNPVPINSVTVDLDGQRVAQHVYSESEKQALADGGAQRLVASNTSLGAHVLTVTVMGSDLTGSPYQKTAKVNFKKDARAKFVELVLEGSGGSGAPVIKAKDW